MAVSVQEEITECIAPSVAAAMGGLVYVQDHEPGIRRESHTAGFRYVIPDGRELNDEAELTRIRKLSIPPAWADVWICPLPNGHLQATGRDAKGRKQYRYHQRWREVRDETKYERTLAFALSLPALRECVSRDLALPGLSREKVLATIVRLLETTHIRVGNAEYARDNKSYGLTTMRDRHVKIQGGTIEFAFRGKSGIRHTIDLHDKKLAKIVQRCRDLPGQHLFQYLDGANQRQSITSSDVNAYLRDMTGLPFTAKDFRTWAGSVWAAILLRELPPAANQRELKQQLTRVVEEVATRLGNTPAIARRCYMHPVLIEAHLNGSLREQFDSLPDDNPDDGLSPEETALVKFLQARGVEK
jgi:DNA topoisomerase I